MKTYTDERYGADADGNRGETATYYELENTKQERLDIASRLYHTGVESDYPSAVEIEFEGIDIEVIPKDYEKELKALEDADDAINEMFGKDKK